MPQSPQIIAHSRALRAELSKLRSSPLLMASPAAKKALPALDAFLQEVEDLADRVTLLEIAFASSTETVELPTAGAAAG